MSYVTGATCLVAVAVIAVLAALRRRREAQERRIIWQVYNALSPLPDSVDKWTTEQREAVRRTVQIDGLPRFPASAQDLEKFSPQRRLMEWEARNHFLKTCVGHPAFTTPCLANFDQKDQKQ
jgi:hypothetical protein